LLAKTIEFKRLGLLIIDEEQHFGVAHKEKLKNLKSDVHVLTLTATPIPRTLQLAMSGVRDLSLITTPPIDRLAIRTYVTPFDKVMVREALLKEKSRGGQAFFVAPRISDLDEIAKLLREFVPEISFKIGHGQLPMSELDEIMTDFYDRKFDVLASTTIVESGIDVPSANTMIIWRADKFGLAQLYQIRGRIGRSKIRAYAYLTYPPRQKMTEQAERRLQVIGSLDSLGAGFTLASHDMDIRGGGNLLGEEQSGHIKEVGFELYQEMLEQAIASLKSGNEVIDLEGKWSPTINLGMSILIPESYVKDLDVRMGLYKRISTLEDTQDIDSFAAELIDRFGKLPQEVDDLLHIIELKTYCLKANISKIEAGAKGVQITFYKNNVANPEAILKYVQQQKGKVKLKPDQSLFYAEDLEKVKDRIPYCKKGY
jgi:transcription-repair coupling factor (superfamily II helicase)